MALSVSDPLMGTGFSAMVIDTSLGKAAGEQPAAFRDCDLVSLGGLPWGPSQRWESLGIRWHGLAYTRPIFPDSATSRYVGELRQAAPRCSFWADSTALSMASVVPSGYLLGWPFRPSRRRWVALSPNTDSVLALLRLLGLEFYGLQDAAEAFAQYRDDDAVPLARLVDDALRATVREQSVQVIVDVVSVLSELQQVDSRAFSKSVLTRASIDALIERVPPGVLRGRARVVMNRLRSAAFKYVDSSCQPAYTLCDAALQERTRTDDSRLLIVNACDALREKQIDVRCIAVRAFAKDSAVQRVVVYGVNASGELRTYVFSRPGLSSLRTSFGLPQRFVPNPGLPERLVLRGNPFDERVHDEAVVNARIDALFHGLPSA